MRMLPDPVLELLRLVPTREFRQIISVRMWLTKLPEKSWRAITGCRHRKAMEISLDVLGQSALEVQHTAPMNMISSLATARLAGKIHDDEVEAQLMFVISLSLLLIMMI